MIRTLSLCPTCYAKIPARIDFIDGYAVMTKECVDHGAFSAPIDKSEFFSKFYQHGTMGRNSTIIVNAHNGCNLSCKWCYYEMDKEKMRTAEWYDQVLGSYRAFNLLLSGGEPTLRPDYFHFTRRLFDLGWAPSSITNGVTLGDDAFFAEVMKNRDVFVTGGIARFAISIQHPKNHSVEAQMAKCRGLENLERNGLKASCAMFSIQSLDELDYIRKFYDATKHLYTMLRVRTMFRNWNNKGDANNLRLSDLYTGFHEVFGDLTPTVSRAVESSNAYCVYMQMDKGINVSLSSAPTVENIDCHLVGRPVYMLAQDSRPYPVPWAQIVNEGIAKGWHNGFKLDGGVVCG